MKESVLIGPTPTCAYKNAVKIFLTRSVLSSLSVNTAPYYKSILTIGVKLLNA